MTAPPALRTLGLCILLYSVRYLADGHLIVKTRAQQRPDQQSWMLSRRIRSAKVAASASSPTGKLEPWDEGDSYSFAVPSEAAVTAAHLKLRVDFDEKVLSGSVDLVVERRDPAATRVVLDSRDLNITAVTDSISGAPISWSWGEPDQSLGRPLFVKLPPGDSVRMSIAYSTSPNSTALAWLAAEQTAGKQHPYVFSQCQAIHCRSIVPLQDSPAVKMTYTAEVTVPAGLTALMSALREGNKTVGELVTFRFRQPVPIPSYLIALAVGALESRPLGNRSSVWSEPPLIDKAAYEFADTEKTLELAEGMLGPYIWGVYDILVLPPSFPYGGMENPCLTFVTPALLAGDRSLTDVVMHEIIHSWTGNLVTNRNWEHSWLNEGFTMFLERKILGRLYGDPARHLSASSGWKQLRDHVRTLGATSPLTRLVPRLKNVDPDAPHGQVAYEKGHTLLWYLEHILGGAEHIESFIKAYVAKYKLQTVDSGDVRSYLMKFFADESKKNVLAEVDWDLWFDSPGMPPYQPMFDTSLIDACSQLRLRWVAWNGNEPVPFSATDLDDFSSRQIIEFLSQMLEEKPLPLTKLMKMEEVYGMNSRKNAEIRFRWLRLSILGRWQEQVPAALEMVTTYGRMKYLLPLYRELYAWPEMRNRTIETYQNNKKNMMFVSRNAVEHTLNLIE